MKTGIFLISTPRSLNNKNALVRDEPVSERDVSANYLTVKEREVMS